MIQRSDENESISGQNGTSARIASEDDGSRATPLASATGHQMQGLHFRRQQVLSGFIADFYCAAAWLVVEVDGSIHDQKAEYDAERDSILAAMGIRILRVTNDEVQSDLDAVLTRIRESCS